MSKKKKNSLANLKPGDPVTRIVEAGDTREFPCRVVKITADRITVVDEVYDFVSYDYNLQGQNPKDKRDRIRV